MYRKLLAIKKELAPAYRNYAEAQVARYTEILNETQNKIDHFNAQIAECDFAITGISFDGSFEDMQRARSQGYEIDYAMGRVFYIAPKEKKS